MRALQPDRAALREARDQFCVGCGSREVVSSFQKYPPNADHVQRGWLCASCLKEWESKEMQGGNGLTMFGYEKEGGG